MNKLISTTITYDEKGNPIATTNYVATEGNTDTYTNFDNGPSQEYYPGTLNKRLDGTSILSPSSTVKDYLQADIQSKHAMGVPHVSEINVIYPDSNFPESLANAQGADGSVLPKDQRSFLAKLGESYKKDPNFDSTKIAQLNHDIDPKSFLPDLAPYAMLGDPRWSLGAAIQGMFQEVLPLISSFLKNVSPIASYINNSGQICDSNGDPIPSSSVLQGITFDQNGMINYDSIPQGQNFKPPTAAEIKSIFDKQKDAALKNHADAFIKYLKTNYLEIPEVVLSTTPSRVALPWKARACYLEFAGMFYLFLYQEIVEKDPAQEVIIVPQTQLSQYKGKVISEAPHQDSNQENDNIKYYYVYRYLRGYKEEDETKNIYNPYNIAERDDPDAPAPPAKDAVYEDGVMISPPFPPGLPGRIETVDMNYKVIRYYPDQKEYLSTALGIDIETKDSFISGDSKQTMAIMSITDPIPDYTMYSL